LVITNPTPVCSPNTIDITATSVTTGSTGGGVLSYWTNPTATNPLTTPNAVTNSATYYIQTTTAMGCKDIKPVTVLINTTPVLTITNPNAVCSPNTVDITAPSVTAGSTGGGTITYWNDAAATSSLLSPNALTTSGTYYIQTTTAAGCKDIQPVNISVLQPPTPIIAANNLSGCAPVCVNFSDLTVESISSWNWNFGNGNSSTNSNPYNCFTNSGQYSVTLTATANNGCTASSQPILINVAETPVASFSTSTNTISMLDNDSTVSFLNQSSLDVIQWFWDFGTGTTISPHNPNPTYAFPFSNGGSYNTTLIVFNAAGCSDTVSQEITVQPYYTFYIPNVFSPDNDGKNDEFFGVGIGIVEYELIIFDRWGEKIFEAHDLETRWNGIAKGGDKIAQQDVYVWKANIKDVFNKKHNYIGTVTLIK
jgi:gliding motility-associated-like protein